MFYCADVYFCMVGGRIEAVPEQFYAITNERKLTYTIISAIFQFAQHDIFVGKRTKRVEP